MLVHSEFMGEWEQLCARGLIFFTRDPVLELGQKLEGISGRYMFGVYIFPDLCSL